VRDAGRHSGRTCGRSGRRLATAGVHKGCWRALFVLSRFVLQRFLHLAAFPSPRFTTSHTFSGPRPSASASASCSSAWPGVFQARPPSICFHCPSTPQGAHGVVLRTRRYHVYAHGAGQRRSRRSLPASTVASSRFAFCLAFVYLYIGRSAR